MPWAYLRFKLAEHWGVPAMYVDEAPANEVAEALTIMGMLGMLDPAYGRGMA